MNGPAELLRPHVGANPWQVGGEALLLRFRELHDQNFTFGDIAEKLSKEFPVQLTRNSCIGKAERLGFPKRAITPSERGKISHHRRRKVQRSEATIVPLLAGTTLRNTGNGFRPVALYQERLREADVTPLHLSLLDLGRDQCRYPYGDTSFTFCGCPTLDGRSYCAPHHELTRRPMFAEAV